MPRIRKNRDQEKKTKEKKRRSKYGQSKLKPAKNGVKSCTVAAGVFLLLLILLMVTYAAKGQAAAIIGAIGIMIFLASIFGVVLGLRGFKEREKDYLTCKIGVGVNGLLVLLLGIAFIRGLM